MNFKIKYFSVAIILSYSVLSSYAMPKGFEPFEDTQYPPFANVEEIDLGYDMRFKDEKKTAYVKVNFKSSPSRRLVLNFKHDPECFYLTMVSIEDKYGKTIMEPVRIEGCSPSIIYSVDINGDGISDYAIYTFSTACGSGVTDSFDFIVSSDGTYIYAGTINTMDPEKRDFVKLSDGKAAMVFTSYIEDVDDPDGMAIANGCDHNFYVYNLIRFKGDKIVSANKLDSRFPRWIQSNPRWADEIKSNHSDTELLTGAQRCEWFLDTRVPTSGIEVLREGQTRVHNLKAWMNGNRTSIFISMGVLDAAILLLLIIAFLKKRKQKNNVVA